MITGSVAYHVLFYTHLYLHDDEASFRPWAQHQRNVQYPSGLPGRPDVDKSLPPLPDPYSRAQVLEFLNICDDMVNGAVRRHRSQSCRLRILVVHDVKLEHQLVNIRHIQHHTAQLMDRLRASAGIGIRWVGAK